MRRWMETVLLSVAWVRSLFWQTGLQKDRDLSLFVDDFLVFLSLPGTVSSFYCVALGHCGSTVPSYPRWSSFRSRDQFCRCSWRLANIGYDYLERWRSFELSLVRYSFCEEVQRPDFCFTQHWLLKWTCRSVRFVGWFFEHYQKILVIPFFRFNCPGSNCFVWICLYFYSVLKKSKTVLQLHWKASSGIRIVEVGVLDGRLSRTQNVNLFVILFNNIWG